MSKTQPLAETDLFTISWYLASHEPFQSFIGITEFLVGLLFCLKKTYLIAGLHQSEKDFTQAYEKFKEQVRTDKTKKSFAVSEWLRESFNFV